MDHISRCSSECSIPVVVQQEWISGENIFVQNTKSSLPVSKRIYKFRNTFSLQASINNTFCAEKTPGIEIPTVYKCFLILSAFLRLTTGKQPTLVLFKNYGSDPIFLNNYYLVQTTFFSATPLVCVTFFCPVQTVIAGTPRLFLSPFLLPLFLCPWLVPLDI